MNLKELYIALDFIFTIIWGFTIIDVMPLIIVGNSHLIFSNLDNGIKVASALIGLIYFVIRIYFYYHKSKVEISYLKEQKTELELRNKNNEVQNFMFAKDFAEMKMEEFENSKKRLKK